MNNSNKNPYVIRWMMIRIMFLILLVFLLNISGCNTKKPIRIGVVGTMSGTQSDLSVSGRRGIELAVKEINASSGILGKQVELVVKDDKNESIRSQEIVMNLSKKE